MCMHYWKWLFLVCFKIFMQYIWTSLIKLHLPVKKSSIKIKKKRKYSKYLHWEIIIFYSLKLTGTKTRRFIMGNVDIFCSFGSISEYLAQLFQCYYPGTFISYAMQFPADFLFVVHWSVLMTSLVCFSSHLACLAVDCRCRNCLKGGAFFVEIQDIKQKCL